MFFGMVCVRHCVVLQSYVLCLLAIDESMHMHMAIATCNETFSILPSSRLIIGSCAPLNAFFSNAVMEFYGLQL